MSLLDIIRIPEMGLEVFKYLDLNDIDACRVVCQEMRNFVDNVVHKSYALAPKLELDYKRQRWMWGKPLTKITINFTCDLQAPFSEHIVERTFLIHSRIVLAIFTRRTEQRYLLTFNDEGERIATMRLHAEIRCVARTKTWLLVVVNHFLFPIILWNVADLSGFYFFAFIDLLRHVGSVDDLFYMVHQLSRDSTVYITVHHPSRMHQLIRKLEVNPFHVPDKPITVKLSSKSVILHYIFNSRYVVECFDIETGQRKYMLPRPNGKDKGNKRAYMNWSFFGSDYAVLCRKKRILISLDTFQPIRPFQHVQMDWGLKRSGQVTSRVFLAMSNRFVVKLLEKPSQLDFRWNLWIGDLLNKTKREFSCHVDIERIENVQIIDEVILIVRATFNKKPTKDCLKKFEIRLLAYDLCQTDEENFWARRFEFGDWEFGDAMNYDSIGSFGILSLKSETANRKTFLRLPFKRTNRK